MRTIREWVKELPSEYQTSILSQSNELDMECVDLRRVLVYFFPWDETVEGYDFWSVIESLVLLQEPIPDYHELIYRNGILINDIEAVIEMQGWNNTFNPQPHYDNGSFDEGRERLDVKDSIVETVIDKYKQRSDVGIEKYKTTLDRNDLTFLEWAQHLQEELMDATLYIQKIMKEKEESQ